MSKYTCSNPDCTVEVTGKCLLSHLPAETCPNASISEAGSPGQRLGEDEQRLLLPTTLVHHGNELGVQQASEMFSTRYGHLVGVLGAYGTGKTCLLCSLYLLASYGDLRPTRLFAGSMTLPGFENRLRLLRKWSGPGLPDKIVDHTILSDPRQPSFLHIALKQFDAIRDLFFTDLPGEWTTDLIQRADVAERFRFLTRADGLIIALQAPKLLAPETRNSQVQSTRMLLQRLYYNVGIASSIPVILAVTRCDITGPTVPPAIYQILEFARELGFSNISTCRSRHSPIALTCLLEWASHLFLTRSSQRRANLSRYLFATLVLRG